MAEEIPSTCHVVAWKPSLPGISEVFHAHIVDWRYPKHSHDTWTVLIVDEGAIRYDLDTRHHGAIGNSVTILPPGVTHNGWPAERFGEFHKRNLYLDREFLPARLIGPSVKESTIWDLELRHSISRLHDQLLDHPEQIYIETSLAAISEALQKRLVPNRDTKEHSDEPLATQLRTYLEDNLTSKVTLGEAARLLDRSVAHLVRSFKEEFGISPYAYLIGARIERARKQLLAGIPPAQVAVDTGFHDQAHLTRHFKRHLPVTPGRYASHGTNLTRHPRRHSQVPSTLPAATNQPDRQHAPDRYRYVHNDNPPERLPPRR